jgi:hypothetical protein
LTAITENNVEMFDYGITENNVEMFDYGITENNVKMFDCAISNITILKRTVKICFILLKNMHFRPYRI